jgi:serine/threonine protein kinase
MDICDKWKRNKSVNPRTNRKIKPTGKVYKDLEVECSGGSQYHRSVRYSPKCLKWFNNPVVNPTTGRIIKIGGPTYKKIEKECGSPVGASSPTRQSPIPVSKKKSPVRVSSSPQIMDVKNWFVKRLNKGKRINRKIESIKVNQWAVCMSGRTQKFKANFLDLVVIGRGTFGQVYRGTLSGDELVIKEAYLTYDEKLKMKEGTKYKEKWYDVDKKYYPEEYKILNLINQLLFTHKCQNFTFTYNMAVCDKCNVFNDTKAMDNYLSDSCYTTFMESASSDLRFINLETFDEQISVLYQTLIALHAIQRYYAIWHTDIKASNILVQRIKPGGYFSYDIDDEIYYIKNTGIVVYLADFGLAKILSPLYTNEKYYGLRNAELLKSGSRLYWKPIIIDGESIIGWDEMEYGTNNYMNKLPDFDITNTMKFPPFDFMYDIQDVIRMFVGGRRSIQSGMHKPMKMLTDEFINLIDNNNANISTNSYLQWSNDSVDRAKVYNIHGTVKYVLAKEMLHQLYIRPDSIDYVIDTFIME